ncbi:MAG: hypothetical protein HGB37_04130 [Candidatus Moranbacteria bacterium]|jgi:hypothetical protein|nr:hypothetical protein [Candidatus Moranbacteria bacterium]
MDSSGRLMRRVRIISAVTAFVVVVGTGLYFLLRTAPTCTDGKKNQGETGIDCGGRCGACPEVFNPEPFVIREAVAVPGNSASEYDVVAKVYNPNDTIGASEIRYDISLRDTGGKEIGRVSGTDSILPQETKTLLTISVATTGTPASVDITFRDAAWQRFSGYQERPKLSLYRTRFDKLSSGPFYGEVFGTLRNDSPFDFRAVTVKVILRNAAGMPIALNQTEVNTLLSGDIRDFTLRWPKAIPGEVAVVETVADTDFYHEQNFIERYRSGNEQFQSLQ